MSTQWNDEDLIRKAMEELPMSMQMPPEFKAKVVDAALESGRTAHRARRPLVVAGLTIGLIAVASAAIFFVPRPATTGAWALMKQAVNEITSFQMELKTANEKVLKISASGSKFAMEMGEGTVMYIDSSSMQIYDPKENSVTKMKFPAGSGADIPDIGKEMTKEFNLKDQIAELEKEYGKGKIKVQAPRTENGRQVYDILLGDAGAQGQAKMTVDSATNLPIHIWLPKKLNDPDGAVELTLRYNDPVDVTPHFPDGVKINELDLGKLKDLGEDIGKDIGKAFDGFGDGFKGFKGTGH